MRGETPNATSSWEQPPRLLIQEGLFLENSKKSLKRGCRACRPCPDLPFLAFLDFLAFFVARNFLAFLSVFPFFPRDFRGSAWRKNPCFFGWFSLLFSKKASKGRSGWGQKKTNTSRKRAETPEKNLKNSHCRLFCEPFSDRAGPRGPGNPFSDYFRSFPGRGHFLPL